jgi:hypothetical protein
LPRRTSIGSPGIRWKTIKARVRDPQRVTIYQPSRPNTNFRNADRQNEAEKKRIFLFFEEVVVIILSILRFYFGKIIAVLNTFGIIELTKQGFSGKKVLALAD